MPEAMKLSQIAIHCGPGPLAYRYRDGRSLEVWTGAEASHAPADATLIQVEPACTSWTIQLTEHQEEGLHLHMLARPGLNAPSHNAPCCQTQRDPRQQGPL